MATRASISGQLFSKFSSELCCDSSSNCPNCSTSPCCKALFDPGDFTDHMQGPPEGQRGQLLARSQQLAPGNIAQRGDPGIDFGQGGDRLLAGLAAFVVFLA